MEIVVVGGGTVLSTNMAQIAGAAGASPALVPTLVTCFAAGNLFGRLFSMEASDMLLRRGRSRADALVVISTLMLGPRIGSGPEPLECRSLGPGSVLRKPPLVGVSPWQWRTSPSLPRR